MYESRLVSGDESEMIYLIACALHRRRTFYGCLFNLASCQAQNIIVQIYRPELFALEKQNKLYNFQCFPSVVAWIHSFSIKWTSLWNNTGATTPFRHLSNRFSTSALEKLESFSSLCIKCRVQ